MEMCPKLDALVLPRARRRFWPTCAIAVALEHPESSLGLLGWRGKRKAQS